MLQWFLIFPEFAEFSESSALFRENTIVCIEIGDFDRNENLWRNLRCSIVQVCVEI